MLKHEHPTYVMPVTQRLSKGLFYRSLLVAGEDPDQANEPEGFEGAAEVCASRKPLVVHQQDPKRIVWGKCLGGIGAKCYQSVFLDGVNYSVSACY